MNLMYVRVDVKTQSKRELISEIKPGYFDLSVKEKAERNMANNRIREMLAGHFNVSAGAVRIISGHHSPRKLIDIKGI